MYQLGMTLYLYFKNKAFIFLPQHYFKIILKSHLNN